MSTFSTCTSSTRPGSPANGDVLFETDTKNVILWDGTNWRGYEDDGISFGANAYSLDFDGTDDNITLGSNISISGTFSISMWVKPDSLLGKYLGDTATDSTFVYVNSSGNITFRGGAGFTTNVGGGSTSWTNTGANLTTGSWQHIVITRDTGFGYTLWRNNTSFTTTGPSSTDSAISFNQIGEVLSYPYGVYNGKFDDLAFYNKELSSSEVSSIYNNNLHTSGLVAFYKFDEGSGSTLVDSVGSNDGTLNNFPASPWSSTDKPY